MEKSSLYDHKAWKMNVRMFEKALFKSAKSTARARKADENGL